MQSRIALLRPPAQNCLWLINGCVVDAPKYLQQEEASGTPKVGGMINKKHEAASRSRQY